VWSIFVAEMESEQLLIILIGDILITCFCYASFGARASPKHAHGMQTTQHNCVT
jgi:hypothetical protein